MRSSTSEAKKRLTINMGSSLLVVFVNAGVFAWLIRYMIRHLGPDIYGMVPLVISFVAYFNLFTMSISNAVSRFVAIHLDKGEIEQSNLYFNTALSALAILCVVLCIPILVLSVYFHRIFQVPAGYETDTSLLFFFVIFSSLLMAITSPFLVSTFVTHRFYLSNLVKMFSHFLRVIVIAVCFTYSAPLLRYVGVSYVAMALFGLVCSVALMKYLTPQLRVQWKVFDRKALREMGHMSGWIAINQVGALFYLSISLIIINLFLVPEELTRYAVIASLATLLGTLGGAISDVFTPIAFEYIAQSRLDILAIQMRRSTKFIGLIMGLPIGLLCGLSTPVLIRWLDPSFGDLGPLTWILIGPWLVSISIRPMFAIFRGLNKVKIPAIVTVIGGVMNLALSLILIRYTDLGIYSVALSLSLCLGAKNFFFTPIYAAIITSQPKASFVKEILSGLIMAGAVGLVTLALSRSFDLASIPRLLAVSIPAAAVYIPFCYGVILNKQERTLLKSIITRQG